MSSGPTIYRAYAKVNLTLDVLGRRVDGFHEVASLVHAVSLADVLEVSPSRTLSCEVTGLALDDADNLAMRAACALAAAAGIERGAHLTLRKHIPEAAGLGGGSSDAAAALVALWRLWNLRLPASLLLEIAARLGSDVPFFQRGGAGVLRGRGERVERLPSARGQWLVLLVPRHSVPLKTAALYQALRPDDHTSSERTDRAAERLRQGQRLLGEHLGNAFERAARAVFPGLADLWQAAENATGRSFHLSGAGPALFALATDARDARQAAGSLDHLSERVFTVRTVARGHVRVRTTYP